MPQSLLLSFSLYARRVPPLVKTKKALVESVPTPVQKRGNNQRGRDRCPHASLQYRRCAPSFLRFFLVDQPVLF